MEPRRFRVWLERKVPAELLFVTSALFHYLGPSFAVLLFARVEPLGVAWLRIVSAAAIFAVWRQPWRAWHPATRAERLTVIIWAVVLALMNSAFYLAIDTVPLGTVAAIEFAGPIVLASIAVRTVRNCGAVLLATLGVVMLSEVVISGSPLGLTFALANMVFFTGYIIIGHRVSRHEGLSGIDGLAMAMLLAAIVSAPIGINDAAPAFLEPLSLLAAIGVALTSSVIPYVLDQLTMARLTRGSYALLSALLPATATIIGLIVLTQVPTPAELAGILLVILAVALHRR